MITKYKVWDKSEKRMWNAETLFIEDEWVRANDGSIYGEHKDIVRDFELMQFTGHKDKHGAEIFEGDVVKHDPVPNSFYTNTNFEIVRARTGEWRIDSLRGGSVLAFHNHQIEIIGNIYENSELIE